MSDETLEDKIRELELELEKKELELIEKDIDLLQEYIKMKFPTDKDTDALNLLNNKYLDKIEQQQDVIMTLEALKELEQGATKKSKKIQAAESRFAYELKEKEKYIRDLKNSMGMLRKDYTQTQQEFEKLKNSLEETSVIRVEDLRKKTPLNALVADLQDKVNKQKSQLKETTEINQKLKDKDEIIEAYKSEINDLNQKIQDFSSASQNEGSDSITKNLIEDLQKELNKSKRVVIDLKQKLSKYDKKSKKVEKKEDSVEIKELKQEIDILKNEIASLTNGNLVPNLDQSDSVPSGMIKTLQDDLQNKLNKSKLEVKSLQEQIIQFKSGKSSEVGDSQNGTEGKLKMQREMAIFLQKQLESKDGEIETIKNEAVQIKKRYRQLENQFQTKDRKISDLQKQIEVSPVRPSTQIQEDPQLALRLRELKSFIEDLKKENIEQRLEINQLRKN
ncbi:MAG: hypothetical protein KGD58_00015 [Candidatus Lokiarchaeota archaeon]|nr:hypothetical protein [Candidatus Lokiarchaeota archaeon]